MYSTPAGEGSAHNTSAEMGKRWVEPLSGAEGLAQVMLKSQQSWEWSCVPPGVSLFLLIESVS